MVEDFDFSPCLAEQLKQSYNITTFISEDLCISENSELCDNTSITSCPIPTTLHKKREQQLSHTRERNKREQQKRETIEPCDQAISRVTSTKDCSIVSR